MDNRAERRPQFYTKIYKQIRVFKGKEVGITRENTSTGFPKGHP